MKLILLKYKDSIHQKLDELKEKETYNISLSFYRINVTINYEKLFIDYKELINKL